MAKKIWGLKHTKVTLTSNRRETILKYKDDGIDWDPKDYNLPEASFPEDPDDLIQEIEE